MNAKTMLKVEFLGSGVTMLYFQCKNNFNWLFKPSNFALKVNNFLKKRLTLLFHDYQIHCMLLFVAQVCSLKGVGLIKSIFWVMYLWSISRVISINTRAICMNTGEKHILP